MVEYSLRLVFKKQIEGIRVPKRSPAYDYECIEFPYALIIRCMAMGMLLGLSLIFYLFTVEKLKRKKRNRFYGRGTSGYA